MSERDQDKGPLPTGFRNPFSEYPRIVRVLAWVVVWVTVMAILKALGII